jgi:hypothetical protein
METGRKNSCDQKQPDLHRCYGEIGIAAAVAAALRYSGGNTPADRKAVRTSSSEGKFGQ